MNASTAVEAVQHVHHQQSQLPVALQQHCVTGGDLFTTAAQEVRPISLVAEVPQGSYSAEEEGECYKCAD